MTQQLAQREEIELVDRVDSPLLLADMMDLGGEGAEKGDSRDTEEEVEEREREKGKKKREWKERLGAGMSAAKRQKLAQDQDKNLLLALEAHDEKAGKMYKEILTVGIDKLVEAIAKASTSGPVQVSELVPEREYKEEKERRKEERLAEQERKLNRVMEEQKIIH